MANLTYTQALILLGIPEEERDEFIVEHDVESMTKLEFPPCPDGDLNLL
ncbi:hypothetical protein DOT_4197 [Desulfosporosinus sp. OT]|nr:hypothetical protein DOT_4197 [Desulfosporosinus sp. OT]